MKFGKILRTVTTAAGSLLCLAGLDALAQTPAEVSLTRLDCGSETQPIQVASFSDTFAFEDLRLPLAFSCYLIRHGNDYMIWDAGNPLGDDPGSPKVSMVDLLAQLKIPPEQIKYLGISHNHSDHTGQARRLRNPPCSSARETGMRSPDRSRRVAGPLKSSTRCASPSLRGRRGAPKSNRCGETGRTCSGTAAW